MHFDSSHSRPSLSSERHIEHVAFDIAPHNIVFLGRNDESIRRVIDDV